ncbi:unnamed protein product, partial [Coregonus sp. 'balchen']
MVFHRVGREKKPVVGELVLGVCATGIIIYELKNHLRTVTRRFLWKETDTISANHRKLTIECGGPSGKKHIFVTESSKIAQYLVVLNNLGHRESLSKSCDEITAKVEARLRQQRELREMNRDLPEPCPLSEMKEQQAW